MFDVVWADPDRELVGQRKARKEKEKEKKDSCSSGNRSVASAETESSSLRSRKPQSFLDSIRLKKKRPKQDTPSLSTRSRLSALSDTIGNRDSILAPPSLASSLGRSGSLQYSESGAGTQRDRFLDSSSSQTRSSQDVDSILSKWTIPNSLATMLSVDEDTELELQSKEGQAASSTAAVGNDIVQTVLRLRGEAGQEVSRPDSRCTSDQDGDEPGIAQVPPLTPMASPEKPLQSPLTPCSLASSRQRTKKASSPRLQILSAYTGNRQHDTFTISDIRPLSVRSSSTSWHTTEPWENGSLPAPLKVGIKSPIITSTSTSTSERSSSGVGTEETSPSSVTTQEDADAFTSLSLNLSGMQREILKMAAADQDTIWRRLTEEWGAWADAALYKQLETERKRWLLSALYSINPVPDTGVVRAAGAERHILAFYETQATASYIAALNAGVPVYHMSPSPLSNKLFPNVSPLLSRAVSCTSLAATPQVFSDIYAQPLPVLVPASDIPLVLRNMHRALKSQGTLHLLLIDPSPARAVMGPRLQAWLDEHLLLNLERLFRCTSPTRLFPTWLRDAHFQVRADAKVVCRFPAVLPDEHDTPQQAGTVDAVQTQTETETQTQTRPQKQKQREQRRLRSLVGQKLWQEIWGPYVTAERWWWEDEDCRDECIRKETEWEYHIVDAVKKERYVASQL